MTGAARQHPSVSRAQEVSAGLRAHLREAFAGTHLSVRVVHEGPRQRRRWYVQVAWIDGPSTLAVRSAVIGQLQGRARWRTERHYRLAGAIAIALAEPAEAGGPRRFEALLEAHGVPEDVHLRARAELLATARRSYGGPLHHVHEQDTTGASFTSGHRTGRSGPRRTGRSRTGPGLTGRVGPERARAEEGGGEPDELDAFYAAHYAFDTIRHFGAIPSDVVEIYLGLLPPRPERRFSGPEPHRLELAYLLAGHGPTPGQ